MGEVRVGVRSGCPMIAGTHGCALAPDHLGGCVCDCGVRDGVEWRPDLCHCGAVYRSEQCHLVLGDGA